MRRHSPGVGGTAGSPAVKRSHRKAGCFSCLPLPLAGDYILAGCSVVAAIFFMLIFESRFFCPPVSTEGKRLSQIS